MEDQIQFKISSALKNLIGRELITDEFVAIFELVKNSFDAHATKAKIVFENLSDGKGSKITIIDDGKGMDYADLVSKWLFVAYSAKKEGTEDREYRDKINKRKFFAGAKGVGRFSCDRLGNALNLITIKDEKGAKVESLRIDWEDFEQDAKKEFVEVKVKHEVLKTNPYDLKHGTVLEVSGLRDTWDRQKISKLRRSLGKLINPDQKNDDRGFSIDISVPDENQNDKKLKERERINGPVKNFLFENLGLRTTQISSEISSDGKLVTTVLKDRGRLIYKIVENNQFKGTLSDIHVHLFQLNRVAKANFTKMMGLAPVGYGSVFLYKNGFRVYPFGEDGDDGLGIDRRKAQGRNRYLGTRDLIGRIEINGENKELKETTSRDGGLIKNQSFTDLKGFFYDCALKRLERYVVDVIKWGDDRKIPGLAKLSPGLNPEDVKPEIADLIANLSNSNDIISLEYDKDFLNIIAESQERSLPKLVGNLKRIAQESGSDALLKEAERMDKQVKALLAAKAEAETGEKAAEEKAKVSEKRFEEEVSQNLFTKSALTTDMKDVLVLQHQIDRSTDRIKSNVDDLLVAVNKKAAKKELIAYIERISLETNKISSIVQFVTKANFNLKAAEITTDMVAFIKEYVENVYREYPSTRINRPYMNFRVVTNGEKFSHKFRPIELIIIIDNLFSNSIKAKARNITITFDGSKDGPLEFKVRDDGTGIEKRHLPKVFDLGFTTTNGSGIGLYHVKQIVEKMGGTVKAEAMEKGAEFVIRIKK
ncbi:MAG: ATP-binding protein [Patescibacteria group bacterium]|nr:ATP-binding protein [Patescibacteria group bacterium]MDE2014930.1 ATP-binding protein [Patescibacteria group bacterium]MDE2226359.1 ATP-binding protein [Patescibacteria group bacterium]